MRGEKVCGCIGARKIGLLLVFSVLFLLIIDSVFAAGSVESTGPGGFGWQQRWAGTSPQFARLTASADRDTYEYGHKEIQVYVRLEDYWAQDCGWWYVTAGKTLTVKIDNGSTTATPNVTSITTSLATKGGAYVTYNWLGDIARMAPGRWNVTVSDAGNFTTTTNATFYIYVKGKLNISAIQITGNNATGSAVTINASVTDHTGRSINGSYRNNYLALSVPNVTAYISGGGDYITADLADGNSDGWWDGTFTPGKPGDHKIVVVASNTTNWLDGRGSKDIAISGSFPSSFASSGASAIAIILMALILTTIKRGGKKYEGK